MAGPSTLSGAEIDRYSVVKALTDALIADGWDVDVQLAQDDWPVGVEINPPQVFVLFGPSENAGFEIGSFGLRHDLFMHIYGKNDADRVRLAEAIKDLFRKNIPIYAYVDGTEANPAQVGFLDTEDVDYRPVQVPSTTPDTERWRMVVHATVLREDS